jgi:hypothetical protein
MFFMVVLGWALSAIEDRNRTTIDLTVSPQTENFALGAWPQAEMSVLPTNQTCRSGKKLSS